MDDLQKKKKERNRIRTSLMNQLKLKGADTPYFKDQVDKYMHMWDLSEQMKEDIEKRGIQVPTTLSSGIETLKTNEFVKMIPVYEKQMMATLNYLGLHVDNVETKDGDDVDL